MHKRTAKRLLKDTDRRGFTEVSPGVYLYTRSAIRGEWMDLVPDLAWKMPWRAAAYWMTDSDGHGPTRVRNAEDLRNVLARFKENVALAAG